MNISIIGSGNVATHLAKALTINGHNVDCVYSRTAVNAERLASTVGARPTNKISDITTTSDIYIICISDDAIAKVSSQLSENHGIVIHTSGATPIDALSTHTHRGVLYPCQTFTREMQMQFYDIPFLIEASDEPTYQNIEKLARSLSSARIVRTDSVGRAHLHVAAVLASNFSNHMLTLAAQYMESHNLPFDLMQSLMQLTMRKAFTIGPRDAQTGPARRGDTATINRHLQLIGDDKHLKNIYNMLTNSIISMYNQTIDK